MHPLPFQAVFDEDAADFIFPYIHVIGPFDLAPDAVALQEIRHHYGNQVIEPMHLRGMQLPFRELHNNGKGKVLPRLREPGIAPLSPAGGLLPGGQDGHGRQFRQPPQGLGIGRVDGVQPDNVHSASSNGSLNGSRKGLYMPSRAMEVGWPWPGITSVSPGRFRSRSLMDFMSSS